MLRGVAINVLSSLLMVVGICVLFIGIGDLFEV